MLLIKIKLFLVKIESLNYDSSDSSLSLISITVRTTFAVAMFVPSTGTFVN